MEGGNGGGGKGSVEGRGNGERVSSSAVDTACGEQTSFLLTGGTQWEGRTGTAWTTLASSFTVVFLFLSLLAFLKPPPIRARADNAIFSSSSELLAARPAIGIRIAREHRLRRKPQPETAEFLLG